jgi:hypothetical protein
MKDKKITNFNPSKPPKKPPNNPKTTPKKLEKCIDCQRKTDNYYITSINSGKICRCNVCYENFILRSTRYDLKLSEIEER